MIYILTGPIRTGKTSALLTWCNNRDDVDGVLCPDDENGKRYFLNIKSNEKHLLEAEEDAIHENDITSVGRFHFFKKSFDLANEYLVGLKDEVSFSYLIIDELGKLELQNQGLHFSAKKLIQCYMLHKHQHLILVVRESLIDAILKHYEILKFQLLKKEDLTKKGFA